MAKLVVLRGDTVDRKVDLVQLPARIGRGPNNAVVLQDPMKGVSREHAEIRLVDGRYLLVDLGSENGIWVAGRRVPEVVLDPNLQGWLVSRRWLGAGAWRPGGCKKC